MMQQPPNQQPAAAATRSLWRLLGEAREHHSDRYGRILLDFVLYGFVATLIVALVPIGNKDIIAWLLVAPVAGLFAVLRWQPTVGAGVVAALTTDEARRVRNALYMALIFQMGILLYAYFVPVNVDRSLVLVLLGVAVMLWIIGQRLGLDPAPALKLTFRVGIIAAIVITAIFFIGGRDKARELFSEKVGEAKESVQGVDVSDIFNWTATHTHAGDTPSLPSSSPPRTASPKSAEIVEHPPVVAPVYDWSQWVSIPRNNWIRIDPEDIVDMQFAGGRTVRIYAVKYNRPVYDGEDIREGAFRLRSASGAPEEVSIAFQPK